MSTQKIRIWHPYRADVVRKGQRKPSRAILRAPLELVVPSTSLDEIRTVGRVVTGCALWAKERRATGGRAVEYRGWNGHLWQPAVRSDGSETDVAGWNRMAAGRSRRGDDLTFDPILTAHAHRTGRFIDWSATKVAEEIDGEIVADDRVAAAEASKRLASALLLVDGKVWQRAAEPRWAVDQLGLGCYCVYLDAPDAGRNPYRDNAETAFRADRLDDMLAWCAEVGRMRNRHPETYGPSGRIVEFDPAYLTRDDLVMETCLLGEPVLKVFAERIDKMTMVGVDAYVAARSAHERLVSGGSRTDVAPFLEAVEDAAADLRRFDYPDTAASSRDEALRILDVLDLRLRRFEEAALALAYDDTPPELAPPSPFA